MYARFVKMFLVLKDLLSFNKAVIGFFSFIFDNSTTRNHAIDHDLRHDVVYTYETN